MVQATVTDAKQTTLSELVLWFNVDVQQFTSRSIVEQFTRFQAVLF